MRPIAIEIAIVERRLHAIRCAAITGSTISAAIRRMPTIRIESAIVSAASIVDRRRSAAAPAAPTRAPTPRRARPRAAPRSSTAITASEPSPSDRDHDEVAARHRQDRAEEVLEEVHVERAGRRDEHDARRDPGVEDDRERLVAGRAACGRAATRSRPRRSRPPRARSAPARRRAGSRPRRRRTRRGRSRRRSGSSRAARGRSRPPARARRRSRRREREPHELEVKHGSACVGGVVPHAGQLAGRAVEDDRARARARAAATTCSTAPNSCET